jgi:hypothetical protein
VRHGIRFTRVIHFIYTTHSLIWHAPQNRLSGCLPKKINKVYLFSIPPYVCAVNAPNHGIGETLARTHLRLLSTMPSSRRYKGLNYTHLCPFFHYSQISKKKNCFDSISYCLLHGGTKDLTTQLSRALRPLLHPHTYATSSTIQNQNNKTCFDSISCCLLQGGTKGLTAKPPRPPYAAYYACRITTYQLHR